MAMPTVHISGWTLFTYTFKIGRTVRTCQRFQPDAEAAAADARVIADDWAQGRHWSVLSVVSAA